MAETKTLFPVGRVLLLVGAVLLVVGLFLPWFTIGGARQDVVAGSYTGVGLTTLLNDLANGPYAWAAFVWLILVAVFGVMSAFVGRKFAMFGTSGILVLILYAILIYVAANLVSSQDPSGGTATISFAYGFILAVIGSALIETGARLKKPAPAAMPAAPPAAAPPATEQLNR